MSALSMSPKPRVYSRGNGIYISGARATKDFATIQLRKLLAYGHVTRKLERLTIEERNKLGELMKDVAKYETCTEGPVSAFYSLCKNYDFNPETIRAFWGSKPQDDFHYITRLMDIATGNYDNKEWRGFLTSADQLVLEQREKESKQVILTEDGKRKLVGDSKKPKQLEFLFSNGNQRKTFEFRNGINW